MTDDSLDDLSRDHRCHAHRVIRLSRSGAVLELAHRLRLQEPIGVEDDDQLVLRLVEPAGERRDFRVVRPRHVDAFELLP